MLDLETFRTHFAGLVPFAAHVGAEFVGLEPGRAVVRLPDAEYLHNHIGSQHAGALFTVDETACGGAFISAFEDLLATITPVVADASIRYTKVARGAIAAEGRIADVDGARAELEREGVVRLDIVATLRDEAGDVVAEMTTTWHVRRNA